MDVVGLHIESKDNGDLLVHAIFQDGSGHVLVSEVGGLDLGFGPFSVRDARICGTTFPKTNFLENDYQLILDSAKDVLGNHYYTGFFYCGNKYKAEDIKKEIDEAIVSRPNNLEEMEWWKPVDQGGLLWEPTMYLWTGWSDEVTN